MPDISTVFPTAGPSLQAMLALLILLLPGSLLLAAWMANRGSQHLARAWSFAEGGALLAMLTALLSAVEVGLNGSGSASFAHWCPSVRLDALSVMMLLLTAFLGWVILRYSRNYLAGDKGLAHYLIWLCLTLATVWLLVIFNNLLLVCLAWSASSLALHQLLIFYKDRPAALMAAHKKFFISRAADVLTLVATLLLYVRFDTLELDRIANALVNVHEADTNIEIAAYLFVISAILKCAQLPLHGWLLQVMEAPTPVSALLHAGIVNIGGFILLRVSGLLELVPAAQLLLVMVGSITATLAALVMMTRISVKVMLAWSTCAQMGFMLLEIGLGAYSLALLHLLAHSLYKAYAFLAAGETVSRQRMLHIAPATHPLNFAQLCLAFAGLGLALMLSGWLTGLDPRHDAVIWLLGGVLASGLLPLVSSPSENRGWYQVILLTIYAFGLSLLYGIWHFIFGRLLSASTVPPSIFSIIFAAICLFGLLIVQQVVLTHPRGALSRWLHPRAFAGFHLDEMVTYLTLRIWPARLTDSKKNYPLNVAGSRFNNKEKL
ncbi:NADH-quinone oxidoreductase subunit L [Undibacterium sp. Dicai25W]|uniref:NADH-quinone oxidoreductase subunit L n=1 Tax=Undibacterium sp. Dicai25W TaxID=3413034 RepID=UPI003BF21BCD